MERIRAIANLQKHAENGGIHVGHRDLWRKRRALVQTRENYSDANQNYIESAYPRQYRVAVWGSARLVPETPEYAFARDLAEALVSRTGCDIATGGGPGIMEAAAEGGLRARLAAERDGIISKSRNHGVGIQLPFEEVASSYLDSHTEHSGFPTRLDEFLAISNAAYVAPGGIGSALEMLMFIQSIQVDHREKDSPIVVHPFWRPMLDAMGKMMYDDRVREGQEPLVGDNDFGKIIFSDDIEEVVEIIALNHKAWDENFHSKVKRQDQTKLF